VKPEKAGRMRSVLIKTQRVTGSRGIFIALIRRAGFYSGFTPENLCEVLPVFLWLFLIVQELM